MPLVEGDVPQDIAVFAPSLAHRVGFREWWERAARRGASPATAIAFNLVTFSADMRWSCPTSAAPHSSWPGRDSYANLSEHGRYLAEHIAGARFVDDARDRPVALGGRVRLIVDEIEEFVTGGRVHAAPMRLLATVLFIDIVDSTVRAATVGDRQWRHVLDGSTSTWRGSWPATTASSSRPPATASWPASPRRPRRCAAPTRW